jgi:hypothetical protein
VKSVRFNTLLCLADCRCRNGKWLEGVIVASNFTGYQIVCPNVKSSAEEDAEWIPKTLQRIAALGNVHSLKLDRAALLCLPVLHCEALQSVMPSTSTYYLYWLHAIQAHILITALRLLVELD